MGRAFFRFSTEHPFLRPAQLFVLAVRAADPAAGTAHAFFEFSDGPFDVLFPGLVFFNKRHPTDPLVAGERSEAVPSGKSGRRRGQGLFEVGRELVNGAAGYSGGTHTTILPQK